MTGGRCRSDWSPVTAAGRSIGHDATGLGGVNERRYGHVSAQKLTAESRRADRLADELIRQAEQRELLVLQCDFVILSVTRPTLAGHGLRRAHHPP